MGTNFSSNLMRNENIVLSAKICKIVLVRDILLMSIFVGFLTIWKTLVSIFTTELVLTSKRLYGKRGLIKTKTLDTPLNKINNVSVSSGLFGKIFGYGTIAVTSSSGLYYFNYIKSPESVRNAIMNEIEEFDKRRIQNQAEQMAAAMQNRLPPV